MVSNLWQSDSQAASAYTGELRWLHSFRACLASKRTQVHSPEFKGKLWVLWCALTIQTPGRQGEGILSLWFAGWPGSLAMSSRSVRDPASKTGWQHWRTSIRGWPLASTYTCMCIEMSKARGWIHQLSWLPNSQPAVTVSSEGVRGPIFFSSTQTHVEVQLYLWMPHLWVLPSNFTF